MLQTWLQTLVSLWFVPAFVQAVSESQESIDMEACFSQLTLDVIGKAVFNYDFNALNTDSPLIQVPACCLRSVASMLQTTEVMKHTHKQSLAVPLLCGQR